MLKAQGVCTLFKLFLYMFHFHVFSNCSHPQECCHEVLKLVRSKYKCKTSAKSTCIIKCNKSAHLLFDFQLMQRIWHVHLLSGTGHGTWESILPFQADGKVVVSPVCFQPSLIWVNTSYISCTPPSPPSPPPSSSAAEGASIIHHPSFAASTKFQTWLFFFPECKRIAHHFGLFETIVAPIPMVHHPSPHVSHEF